MRVGTVLGTENTELTGLQFHVEFNEQIEDTYIFMNCKKCDKRKRVGCHGREPKVDLENHGTKQWKNIPG